MSTGRCNNESEFAPCARLIRFSSIKATSVFVFLLHGQIRKALFFKYNEKKTRNAKSLRSAQQKSSLFIWFCVEIFQSHRLEQI